MSDCLPRSCPELNKHLLAEDSDSGVEAIVCNCKMKPHRSSSPLGPQGPASCCPSVFWSCTENSRAQQFCPSFMGTVQLTYHVAVSCFSGEGGRNSKEIKYYFRKTGLFLCVHGINSVAPPDIWQILWLCLRDFGEEALALTLNAAQETREEKKLLL